MRYQVVDSLKVRTLSGVRELKAGDTIIMSEDMAFRLVGGGRVRPLSPDCFSLDGLLEEAFTEALVRGWTDDKLLTLVDELIQAGALQSPWGFMAKDSLFVGDFWIISDASAMVKLPAGAKSFTLDELRPIVDTFRVFEGATLMEVKM